MTGYDNLIRVVLLSMCSSIARATVDHDSVTVEDVGRIGSTSIKCIEPLEQTEADLQTKQLNGIVCAGSHYRLVLNISLDASIQRNARLSTGYEDHPCPSRKSDLNIKVLDKTHLVYHCKSWNHLAIASTGTGKPLTARDLDQNRKLKASKLTKREIFIGNGSKDISSSGFSRGQYPVKDVRTDKIVDFTTQSDRIILVTEPRDRASFKLYALYLFRGTIKHVYTFDKSDRTYLKLADISAYHGPVYFLLIATNVIEITKDGESRILTENVVYGRYLLAVSPTDIFFTQYESAKGGESGKLVYLDSDTKQTVTICHATSDNPGRFQQCGIKDPTYLIPVNHRQVIVADKKNRLRLLSFEATGTYVPEPGKEKNEFVLGLNVILTAGGTLLFTLIMSLVCGIRACRSSRKRQEQEPTRIRPEPDSEQSRRMRLKSMTQHPEKSNDGLEKQNDVTGDALYAAPVKNKDQQQDKKEGKKESKIEGKREDKNEGKKADKNQGKKEGKRESKKEGKEDGKGGGKKETKTEAKKEDKQPKKSDWQQQSKDVKSKTKDQDKNKAKNSLKQKK